MSSLLIGYRHKVFGGMIAAMTETLKQLAGNVTELSKEFNQILEKICEAIKATLPHLKESFDKIFRAALDIIDAVSKLGLTYLKAIFNVISEHQKEIKKFLSLAAEIVQDITKTISKEVAQIEKEIKNFVAVIIEQIKALPVYEFLKGKYAELADYQVPETILIPIQEAYVQFRKMLPTEELKELFTVVYDYVIKHVKREKVDNSAEIKKIYAHVIEAIQSIISLIQNRTNIEKYLGVYITGIPADIGIIKSLPGISTLRISVLNLLQNGELPTLMDVYRAYKPSAHLTDLIPPFSKTGIFLEGGHFFTFDGRHLTLAGSCDYIIAQDMRDGNFSVVGTLANGKLSSVTVTAPGESITIKSNGNVSIASWISLIR